MRIISGNLRGRKLTQLSGNDIRPTSDRVREAVFNILGPGIRDARVLDLYAGTGALGLEALSRGARHAVFVDLAPESCAVIQKNIDLCKMTQKTLLLCHDIMGLSFPKALGTDPFDLIFVDPPYGKEYAEKTLGKKSFTDLLAPKGIVVVEQSVKESLDNTFNGLDIYRQKKYSKTFVSFLRKPEIDKGSGNNA
ncbi:MAG: 16S rRNA (guanine(966)-N(2))-methyltransferase RsmD [Proteobacteria bacterium]|nr:16S rRNA (guanine(966)-N(2))-methyltransferase RsmD [Desulfobacula sp.]MBU4131427.1 16S rRNA (guanine(966)-N(2))-methyltransferase RsmD [Pseudomonadota bacterium]